MASARRAVVSSLAAVSAALSLVAACGGDDDPGAAAGGMTLDVIAEFYPLYFVTERVGEGFADVSNLTPAAAEPHDLELTPRQHADLDDADLIVYLGGMIPAVDDAVSGVDDAFDVGAAAHLVEHAGEHAEEGHHDEHDDEHGDEGHDHGVHDPHFWLDPTRLADVADAVATQLAERLPDQADRFSANAADLRAELEALDAEFAAALADCARRDVVTSHTAFGYLTGRYGLNQVGVTGLSPHEEPSPARLAEVSDFVEEHGVTTIFHEVRADARHADTVASETGAAVAVLDPLETLSDDSAGDDYFAVMRANLDGLRAGLGCR